MGEAFIISDKSGPLPVPKIDNDKDEEKGSGGVVAITLVRLL